ncbi:pentatricopeptide repeat-containing protein At2g17670 [Macadamia integrifolia]|uniref:pentatricopeptide repeat-containing protein At2g17670 n=1 Tax=Macadamia integrifolia TaxID=60698 RepID=UPI001C4F5496|nr:pentatricopeptide repeat-containing protein At2g17670 [Macadamia integrifolia]XP_042495850.1 pentatricopeptide repeat-containing protein At2g17670 [Macadamia integrifolia]
MGKISPSLRTSFPVTGLLKNPTSSPTPSVPLPRHVPSSSKKPPSKKKQPKTDRTPDSNSMMAFKSPSLSDAKKTFNSILSTSPAQQLDPRFHNALLQSFSLVSSTPQDSLSFLDYMTKTHPSFIPNRYTYHILLSHSCKSPSDSNLSSLRKTLDLMTHDGFPPDQSSVDLVVRSLCSVGREDLAVEMVKEFSLKHSPPDSFTYNFFIRHLSKTRVLSSVYSLIEDLQNSVNLKPDLVTYTILIDSVCRSKNLREATRLLGVLRESGFKPDCFLYNTIMKGYCILDSGSEVIGVYKKMMEDGVEPDLVTYNTLIYGLSKAGRVNESRKFLRVMAEMGHFPDAITYTSLMNGMCRKGDALGALELLEEMEQKGCSPNSCTYNTLLHGLGKSRFLDKGVELYEMMKSSGMKLETASYATFVRALCRADRIAEAYGVFDYAVESKSLTDVAAYSALESSLKWLKKTRGQGTEL